MTRMSAAKMTLLGLALVTLAGAETVWSLALSSAPDPECACLAASAARAAAQARCCEADTNPCGCESGQPLRPASPAAALTGATANTP